MSGWLDPELTTIAFCWRLDRRDGVSIGFTSHDRDIVMGGFRYSASPGLLPSAIGLSGGLDVGTLDLSGALTSDAITEADLMAGRWDGARLRLTLVDWTDPDNAPLFLTRGELGEVGIRDTAFTAELRGPTAALDVPVAEATSPDCRADLGDRRCGVDMAGRVRIVGVTGIDGDGRILIDEVEPVANAYGGGRLHWISGGNAGLPAAIAQSSGMALMLRDPPYAPVQPGDRAEIGEGCDKILATCRDRFANAVNFRGEPYLPGTDLLTRYPGA